VIQAFQEVSTSLAALEKLAGAETEQIRSVKALEKSDQISQDRYCYGLSSYYEFSKPCSGSTPPKAFRRNSAWAG